MTTRAPAVLRMGSSRIFIVYWAVFLTVENSDKKLRSSSEIVQFSLWGNTLTKKPGLGSRLLPRPTATTRSRKRSSSTLLWSWFWSFCGDHHCNYHCDCFFWWSLLWSYFLCGYIVLGNDYSKQFLSFDVLEFNDQVAWQLWQSMNMCWWSEWSRW